MANEKRLISMFSALVGGISGVVAGLIGDSAVDGLISGIVVGGAIGFLYPDRQRDWDGPRINVFALPPAGLIAGATASVITSAGVMGAFISSGLGYVLGMFLPALLISIFLK